MGITLAENMKVVTALAPGEGANAATFSQGICLKYVHRLFVIVNYVDTGVGATITLWRDTDVGMATANLALLGNNVRIWANADTDVTDTLVRQADGIGYTFGDGNTSQQVVFEVDPSSLGETANYVQYDCLDVYFDFMPVAEHASVEYIAMTRYPQALPPSIIVN